MRLCQATPALKWRPACGCGWGCDGAGGHALVEEPQPRPPRLAALPALLQLWHALGAPQVSGAPAPIGRRARARARAPVRPSRLASLLPLPRGPPTSTDLLPRHSPPPSAPSVSRALVRPAGGPMLRGGSFPGARPSAALHAQGSSRRGSSVPDACRGGPRDVPRGKHGRCTHPRLNPPLCIYHPITATGAVLGPISSLICCRCRCS